MTWATSISDYLGMSLDLLPGAFMIVFGLWLMGRALFHRGSLRP